MAEAQDTNAASEPSMEEILASIRKIIADEKEPSVTPSAPETEEPIDLTQMVQDDGSIVDLADAPAVETPPASSPAETFDLSFEPIPEPPQPEKKREAQPESAAFDDLLSEQAAKAATSSLAALVHTVQHEKTASLPSYTLLGHGNRTLEDIVLELMKPMLKDWLDEHLPAIVDRLVQKEVEKIVRRAQE